ncbi:MAG: efflux RND transporter permease subunit, partial [Anaerovorax sp.]
LPEECQAIDVDTDLADSAGLMVTVGGDEISAAELKPYAEKMKEKLLTIKGISKVQLEGVVEKNIEVVVDTKKLAYFNLSLDDIVRVLTSENLEIPSGYIEENNNKIMVNIPGGYENLTEIENSIVGVSSENGSVLRIRDLAKVNLVDDTSGMSIYNDGARVALVTGYFEKNKNVLSMSDQLKQAIKEVSSEYPDNVWAKIVLFQPDEISKAVHGFMTNLICGIFLVILVVWLGMSWRNAIIISTVIPLSILMTMIAMKVANIPIHEISTAGLIISLGMLVDNAIVVSDAIQVKLDQGMERIEACAQGVKQSSMPILSSTATTIVAFIPLAVMSGTAGEYIFSVPFTVIVALVASYVNAMLVVPTLAFLFFKVNGQGTKDLLAPVRRIFNKLLDKGMNNRGKTIGLGVALLFLAVIIVVKMGLSFFPYADKDMMQIKIASEGSGNIANTLELTKTVETILKK